MDRERADIKRAFESLADLSEMKPLLLQLPIGSENNFKGIVDFIEQKAYIYNPGDESGTFSKEDIPADMKDETDEYREKIRHWVEKAEQKGAYTVQKQRRN